MLVLSRYEGEEIVMQTGDGEIVVKVVEVRPNGQVRLGIVAPNTVPVDRLEVAQAKARGQGTPVARPRPAEGV
jgi:carbon storage regulator CsrA